MLPGDGSMALPDSTNFASTFMLLAYRESIVTTGASAAMTTTIVEATAWRTSSATVTVKVDSEPIDWLSTVVLILFAVHANGGNEKLHLELYTGALWEQNQE